MRTITLSGNALPADVMSFERAVGKLDFETEAIGIARPLSS